MKMKLGLGLYRHMLQKDYFQFAAQCGCTHLIVHLANYYSAEKGIVTATNETSNYGTALSQDPIWEPENLLALQKEAGEHQNRCSRLHPGPHVSSDGPRPLPG